MISMQSPSRAEDSSSILSSNGQVDVKRVGHGQARPYLAFSKLHSAMHVSTLLHTSKRGRNVPGRLRGGHKAPDRLGHLFRKFVVHPVGAGDGHGFCTQAPGQPVGGLAEEGRTVGPVQHDDRSLHDR